MNIDDELLEDLIHAYHASDEGKQPFNPNELKNLDKLILENYIEVTICNEDKRSTHKAETCRVKLAWLLPKGIDAIKKYFDTNIDELINEVRGYLNGLNPRIQIIVKYLLTVTLDPSLDYIGFSYFSAYEDPIDIFKSLLPKIVNERLDNLLDLLRDLNLVDYASVEHVVSGWKERKLVVADHIKNRLLNEFIQIDLPLIFDLLLPAYYNIYAEYFLTRYDLYVDRRFDITDYLVLLKNHRVLPERVLFQYSKPIKHHLSVMDVRWDVIDQILDRLYSSYTIEYKLDIEVPQDIVRFTYSYLPGGYVSAVEKRLEVTENFIKKFIEIWIEKGSIFGINLSDYSLVSLIREYESKHR